MIYFAHTPESDIDARIPRPLPWWIDNDNCYRASRYGVDLPCIIDEVGRTQPVREQLENLLEILEPVSAQLGESADLERVSGMLNNPGYAQQRALFEETGSPRMVVRSLAERLDAEISCLET